MKVIRSVKEMTATSRELRNAGKITALVPTMGYFHEGHLSLMDKARELADKVIVSLFVNPIQFGPTEDLATYPRDEKRDLSLAQMRGVDYMFIPSAGEMYGSGFQTSIEVSRLSKGLCGASRPGHFRGVATVVAKLFNITRPHKAIFGQKDFQQLLVIKRMVKDLNMDVEIISHPIVREPDGLAMSSRNTYLSSEERKSALSLHSALKLAEHMIKSGQNNSGIVAGKIEEHIEAHPHTKIDYVFIGDPDTLEPVKEIKAPVVIALAVFVGSTRLIDNAVVYP